MKTSHRYLAAIGVMLVFALLVNGLAFVLTRPAAMPDDPFKVSYRNNMKQTDAESVNQVIEADGFDSAFSHSSTYRDINDMKFHELRKAYLAARTELMEYINEAAHKKIEIPYYMAEYK